MKLAGFGLVVGAVGLILGVDGLLLAGGLWIVTGLLVRTLVHRNESGFAVESGVEAEIGRIEGSRDGSPRLGLVGAFLLLVVGLGSIALGVLGTGFSGDYESLRWFPFAVGLIITLIGAISIPVELGVLKAETVPVTPSVDSPAGEGEASDPGGRLAQLEDLRRQGLVTAKEYDEQRDRILRSI